MRLTLHHDAKGTKSFNTKEIENIFLIKLLRTMKKRVYGALILGSLLLTGGMVTSCSDYDDDINSLTGRVDALEKTVADLKTAIEGGSVITNVQSTANGVTVTLSDGKTFEVKNGTNGTPGTVIDIKTVDGVEYWFLDNNNTGYPVKGAKGDDGKEGIYYAPNATTGTWWKYDPNVENDEGTDTQISYVAGGTVTAVYDKENGVLTLKNVDGVEDGTLVLPFYTKGLQSIAFIPEYYDTDMGMGVIDFYTISKNSKVLTSTNAIVNYRLNPNNANINDVTFDFIDRVVVTRAEDDAYQLLSIVGEPERQAGGEITITAKSNKSLEDLKSQSEEKKAIVALRAQKTEDGETSEIVSDYATVNVVNLTKFAIIDKADYAADSKEENIHYYASTENEVKAQSNIDGTIEYNSENKSTSQLDLLTLVETYETEKAKKTFSELAVAHTYKFTALDYTPVSGDKTNQKQFIEFVNDNTVQINKNWLSNGIAAVGKTPIIKVETLVEGEVVATAYIKLQIVQKDRTDKNVEINLGDIQYTSIDPNYAYELKWDQMNQEVLDELGLTNETFGEIYNTAPFATSTDPAIIGYYWTHNEERGTSICSITLNQKCKTGEQKFVITYEPKDNKAYPVINITFTYNLIHTQSLPDLNKDYQAEDGAILVKGRLHGEQWKMISEVKEHFKNYLANWNLPKYHSYPKLSIVVDGTNEKGVTLAGTDIRDQIIYLDEALTVDTKDVKVLLTSTMDNGEVCTDDYVVRFLRPYKVKVGDVTLNTLTSEADTEDLRDYIVIKDIEGKVLYEKQKFTEEAISTYKLDKSGMTFKFNLIKDASFGDKLEILNDGYTISWDNGGNDLQNEKTASYEVIVTVPDIAECSDNGNIKVFPTAESK